MNQQERSARQTSGHQQSQSRRQKEELRVPTPWARGGRGQCACAAVRVVGVNLEFAPRAHVAGRAGADEAGEVSVAAAAVGAGARSAWVGALATVAAAEAQRAGAAARAAALQARAAVGAGAAGAVVQVVLAARPREAGTAAAAQGVAQIQADPAIPAWLQAAPVHPLLTVGALETRWAVADVGRIGVCASHTQATVEARSIRTCHPAHLTPQPVEPTGTGAFEGPQCLTTAAPVGTRVPITGPGPRYEASISGRGWTPGAEAAGGGDRDCAEGPSPALQTLTFIGLLTEAVIGAAACSTCCCGGRRGRKKRNIDEGQSQRTGIREVF